MLRGSPYLISPTYQLLPAPVIIYKDVLNEGCYRGDGCNNICHRRPPERIYGFWIFLIIRNIHTVEPL